MPADVWMSGCFWGRSGFFPPGTLVELNTGEMAVVLAVPALPVHYARPPVRILYDARMRMIEPARDIDLAAPVPDGEPARCLRKVADADPKQMQQMRAYVDSLSGFKAPASARQHVPARSAVQDADPHDHRRAAGR